MAEGREEFERQLRELGYKPEPDQPPNRVVFPYTAMGGRFEAQVVKIGLEVPPDFSRTPPPGPHVSPKILPINTSASAHPDKVADSPFGPEWEYWSRPSARACS